MVKGLDNIINRAVKTTGKVADDALSSSAKPVGDSFSAFGKKASDILPSTHNSNVDNVLSLRRPFKPKPPKKIKPNNNGKFLSPDEIAQKVGFKSEDEFFTYIEQFQRVGKWDRMKKVFTLLRNNKKTIALLGAGATAVALHSYCHSYQRMNSGCFRYRKKKNGGYREKTRTKIGGNFCNPAFDLIEAKIPKEKHPLYTLEKWDCGLFNKSDKELLDNEVSNILDIGCGGLCSVENYNKIVNILNARGGDLKYKPLDTNQHRYIYKCERATVLRLFTEYSGNAINDIITGFNNSELGERLANLFDFSNLKVYIFIIVILFLYYKFICKREYPQEIPQKIT